MVDVGFVGAGQMGRPMVERLLAAGHDVSLFARRAEVQQELRKAGAQILGSPREVAASADVVLACVFSDAQLLEVSEGPDGLLSGLRAGAVLASHVTGSLSTLKRLGSAAKAREARAVDAPVSGTAADIRAGQLTILLGGPDDAAARCETVFGAFAGTVYRTGAVGSALAVKLVNNLMFASNVQVAAAAADVATQLGVNPATFLSAIAVCSGASYAAGVLAAAPDFHQIAEVIAPSLRKDVAACATELGAHDSPADLLIEIFRRGPLALSPSR